MAEWLGILLFIVAILVVVMIHESGHFVFAKLFKMKVEEFFVGFGPRLWSTRRGETEYGVKALPFGGYVRIAGMNPFQDDIPEEELPRTYGARPIWQRALVILAGPLSHFLMAIIILTLFFSALGVSKLLPSVAEVNRTLNGQPSPAFQAGFRAGDQIVAVGGIRIEPTSNVDVVGERFVTYTRAHVGEPIEVTVKRDGKTLTLTAAPVLATVDGKDVGRLGIILGAVAVGRERSNPFVAFGRGVTQTWETGKAVVEQLGKVFGPAALKRIGQLLLGSTQRRATDPTSIVGGARLAGQAAQAGAWDFFIGIIVIFNVFVGILNLVPLPPLDGGHLAVLVYEKARRRKPDLRKLVPVTALVTGFIVLFALAVSYLDIVKPLPSPFQ